MLKSLILALLMILTLSFTAQAVEIDDRLIQAVIMAESGGNPRAISPCGAVGLMQITPIVLKEYNDVHNNWEKEGWGKNGDFYNLNEQQRQLFSPEFNIEVGTFYLNRIKDHYLNNKEVKDILVRFITSNPKYYSQSFKNFLKNYSIRNWEDYELALVLAAYNFGPTALKKVNYDINRCPKETRDYIRKVMKLYRKRGDKL